MEALLGSKELGWQIGRLSSDINRFAFLAGHVAVIAINAASKTTLPNLVFLMDLMSLPVVASALGTLYCSVFPPLRHMIWPLNLSLPFSIFLRS